MISCAYVQDIFAQRTAHQNNVDKSTWNSCDYMHVYAYYNNGLQYVNTLQIITPQSVEFFWQGSPCIRITLL